jgi:hypothetical protein
MNVRRWLCGSVCLVLGVALAQGAAPPPVPPWQRTLKGYEARRAQVLDRHVNEAQQDGDWARALKAARELAALRHRRQGHDHHEAVSARWRVVTMERERRTKRRFAPCLD